MRARFLILRVRMLAATCLLTFANASLAAPDAAMREDPVAPLTAAYVRAVNPGGQADMFRELIGTVLARVQRSFALEVDTPSFIAAALKSLDALALAPGTGEPAAVFKSAMNAALAALDPHSNYIDPREHSARRSEFTGSFAGLGMHVEMSDGLVRVVTTMEDTPASRARLKSGDLIVQFDGQPVLGMTLADAVARMRGEPGTPIALRVRRPGQDDEFAVSLVRAIIRTQALRWRLEDDVLVLRLARFTDTVAADIRKAIGDAVSTSAPTPRAVVLDMRGNPGGLLNQAVATADTFLARGEIVSLRGRWSGNRRTWHADAAESLAGVPMVVLIDGASASAAELVAAALQENGRATVMGQRSYGKGSVQTMMSLGADKGALRLTTALYFGPSGRTVQKAGVSPDIELMAADPAQGVRRRESDRARALPGGGDLPLAPRVRVEQARCAAMKEGGDPALTCALAFLRAGDIEVFQAELAAAEVAELP
jgi:C-terminal peptidase prc